MILYLFNESTQKQLELKHGIWYTDDLQTAKEMQKSAREYLKCVGLKSQIQYIQIIDQETKQVIT